MDATQVICCGTCPHYQADIPRREDEPMVGMCRRTTSPWRDMRRPPHAGTQCPDHPENVAALAWLDLITEDAEKFGVV